MKFAKTHMQYVDYGLQMHACTPGAKLLAKDGIKENVSHHFGQELEELLHVLQEGLTVHALVLQR